MSIVGCGGSGFFLLQKVVLHHELHSAFMQDSIHGWVYLEVTMNDDLMHLLMCMPGIIYTQKTGSVHQQINFKDWTKMLTMQDPMPMLGLESGCRCAREYIKGI